MKNVMMTVLAVVCSIALVGCAQDGQRGADGTNGVNGAQGIKGDTGAQGPQGNPGVAGPAGPKGTNGSDAIPVTIVKLCPDTPAYGSTYVEVAMCLNGSLYAVYSANNGFLTLLTDGAYASNAVGSACNFNVQGCKVTAAQ